MPILYRGWIQAIEPLRIVDIIEEVKADRVVDAMTIAWAILKIAVAGAVTEIIAIVFVVAGGGMITACGSSLGEKEGDEKENLEDPL